MDCRVIMYVWFADLLCEVLAVSSYMYVKLYQYPKNVSIERMKTVNLMHGFLAVTAIILNR